MTEATGLVESVGLSPGDPVHVVTVLDAAGRVRYASPTMATFLGVEEASLVGRSVFESIHPDDLPRVWATFVDVATGRGSHLPLELRVRHHDDAWRRIEVVASSLVGGSDGSAVVVMTHDRATRPVRDPEPDAVGARYRLLVERSPDAIAIVSDDEIIYTNAAGVALLGATEPRDLLGRDLLGFVHPEARESVADSVATALAGEVPRALTDVRLVRLDGDVIDVEGAIVPTPHDGAPALQIVLRDVTERHQVEADLAYRAFHDPLTGLANRHLLVDRVEHACARAQRTGSFVGILFTDVDDFKEVNDRYGHQAGDAVLQTIGNRLRGALRPSDTVARYGGDEFVVLCEDVADPTMMSLIARRVEDALSAPFRIADEDVRITVSVGAIAEASPDGSELIERADQAMYEAKAERKHQR